MINFRLLETVLSGYGRYQPVAAKMLQYKYALYIDIMTEPTFHERNAVLHSRTDMLFMTLLLVLIIKTTMGMV